MALNCRCFTPPLSSSLPFLSTSYDHSPKLPLFGNERPKSPIPFFLYATPPLPTLNSSNSHSPATTPIFLPFLQEEVENPESKQSEQQQEEEEDSESTEEDPILRFFKFRASTQDPDPGCEGKLSLQKNRRSSWHLASKDAFASVEETEFEEEQFGSEDLDSGPEAEGVVGEILRIARDVQGENLTLGELLGPYEGRVGGRECVEVLGLMGQEGLIMGCLYFFEWMGLQEPSLITSRACSVLFPVLGRAGMGDKLMVLFRNLPNAKQFRDVHIYNAAISGLLCCRR